MLRHGITTSLSIINPHKKASKPVESIHLIEAYIEPMHKILGEKSRTAVALHHSQVAEKPFNFFVLNRNLLHNNTKDYGTFCNAKIIEKDLSTKMTMWEGCLSWPFRKTIKKQRYARVKVAYDVMIDDLNIPGKVILKHEEAWVEGLIAQIFQHEIDHANGIHIY